MTDQHLRTLLDEAATDVPAPHLTELALAGARRRRRVRLAAVTGGTVVAVTTGVLIAGPGGPHRTAPPPAVQSTVTPTPPEQEPALPHRLTESMVQPRWAPQRLDELKWRPGQFPRSLSTSSEGLNSVADSPLPAAVAVFGATDSLTDLIVVGADGQVRAVRPTGAVPLTNEYGDDIELGRSSSLSYDGTRVAVLQPDAVVVVDVTRGTERRYPLPERLPPTDAARVTTQWSHDGSELLVSLNEYLELHLGSEDFAKRPFREEFEVTTYAPDGSVLEYASDGPFTRELRRYEGDERVGRIDDLGHLGVFHSMKAGAGGIAAGREVVGFSYGVGDQRLRTTMSGVLVITEDAEARALLPMSDWAVKDTGYYSYLVGSEVLGWVDDETVLISFGELGKPHSLVTWNYVTGELLRVADVDAHVEMRVAAGLLGAP